LELSAQQGDVPDTKPAPRSGFYVAWSTAVLLALLTGAIAGEWLFRSAVVPPAVRFAVDAPPGNIFNT
jgi:hypothetical protein